MLKIYPPLEIIITFLPGFHATDEGATTCDACLPGSASATAGSVICDSCAPGSSNSNPGQSLCPLCTGGSHASAAGSLTCDICVPGSFSGEGAPDCSLCPKGKYNDEEGLTSCSECALDHYADKEGQTSCEDCPAGLNTEFPGADTEGKCVYHYCIAGWAGEPWGCSPCQPGSFSGTGYSPQLFFFENVCLSLNCALSRKFGNVYVVSGLSICKTLNL